MLQSYSPGQKIGKGTELVKKIQNYRFKSDSVDQKKACKTNASTLPKIRNTSMRMPDRNHLKSPKKRTVNFDGSAHIQGGDKLLKNSHNTNELTLKF